MSTAWKARTNWPGVLVPGLFVSPPKDYTGNHLTRSFGMFTMDLNPIHTILFNAHIMYSVGLGIWAGVMAARNEPISGNFWGAVATSVILAGGVLLLGIIMTAQGLRPQRLLIYYLYVIWLVIIMPGLFTMLRGRDDRHAAIAFSILAFFNATTSISMWQRSVIGPWTLVDG